MNKTFLTRQGNKSKLHKKIIPYFPKHDFYIDMFVGAGGIFFEKPRAKYNTINDIDHEIFNLYTVFKNNPDELIKELELMPVDNNLFTYWKFNPETDPIKKAVRFLFLSNHSYLSGYKTLKAGINNDKKITLEKLYRSIGILDNVTILSYDFREFLKKIPFRTEKELPRTFIYADPPYYQTGNKYKTGAWGKQEVDDLFSILTSSGIKFAMSEYDSDYILEKVKEYNLNYIEICERRTIKNRNIEILITNYNLPENSLI